MKRSRAIRKTSAGSFHSFTGGLSELVQRIRPRNIEIYRSSEINAKTRVFAGCSRVFVIYILIYDGTTTTTTKSLQSVITVSSLTLFAEHKHTYTPANDHAYTGWRFFSPSRFTVYLYRGYIFFSPKSYSCPAHHPVKPPRGLVIFELPHHRRQGLCVLYIRFELKTDRSIVTIFESVYFLPTANKIDRYARFWF